jgi:hypothetical protein
VGSNPPLSANQSAFFAFFEEIQTVEANVRAFRPRFRAHYPFYVGEQIEVISRLSNNLIESEEISNYIGWLYTPMALPAVRALKLYWIISGSVDRFIRMLRCVI